jgi:hypothetical protein
MRNLILGLATVASAALIATPAAAQYYPRGYGYSRDYGASYNNYGDFGSLQRRLYNVERSLDGVPRQAAYQLSAEANALERQLRMASRNGLNPYEAHELNVRIGQLEQRQLMFSRKRGYGYNNYSNERGGEGRHRGWNGDRDDD